MDDVGFIICDEKTHGSNARSSWGLVDGSELSKNNLLPRKSEKPVRDDIRSANLRIESPTHLMEPVYYDGKPTGEWRVYIFETPRVASYCSPLEINWHQQFESKEAADKWVAAATASKNFCAD